MWHAFCPPSQQDGVPCPSSKRKLERRRLHALGWEMPCEGCPAIEWVAPIVLAGLNQAGLNETKR